MEAKLNDGLSPLLHPRLSPTKFPKDSWVVHLSSIHDFHIIRLIDLFQIPLEHQRGLVCRVEVEAHPQIHQQLTILPVLNVLPVTMRKLVEYLCIWVPAFLHHNVSGVLDASTFHDEEK